MCDSAEQAGMEVGAGSGGDLLMVDRGAWMMQMLEVRWSNTTMMW